MRASIKILLLFLLMTLSSYSQWIQIKNIPAPYSGNYWLDVYFLESNTKLGWICGYNGYVIRTTDGGNTWEGSQVRRMDIDSFYVDNKIIYDTSYQEIYTQLESIHFANESIGYTSGNDMIFKSTDGGMTWFKIAGNNMRIWGNFFITPDIGLAVGGGCGDNLEFHRTEDGGKTWHTYIEQSMNSGLTDAMLYEKDGLGYASSSGLIWRTDDGGRTWYILSVSGKKDWQEEITNYGNSFLVPYDSGCTGSEGPSSSGGLRFSSDYGGKWIQFNTNQPMFGSFLIDSLRGWGCGHKSRVYYTSNGGIHWELKNCGIDEDSSLDDIWFIDDNLGWVVGAGVYKTYYYDTIISKIVSADEFKFCQGDTFRLESDKDYMHYNWSTGDTTKFIYAFLSGYYILNAYNSECDLSIPDTIYVELYPRTDVLLMTNKPPDICEGDSVKLWLDNVYISIEWSTNESCDTISVKKAGNYTVTITDTNGCQWSKTIYLNVKPLPEPQILALDEKEFCKGDSVVLTTDNNYPSYYWFINEKPDSMISDDDNVTVFDSGNYRVIVTNEFGCSDTSESIRIQVWDISNRLKIFAEDMMNYLDFDSLFLTYANCLPLKVLNQSDVPIILNNVYILHNTEFSLPQSQFPLLIEPGETEELLICFRPIESGFRSDTVIIEDTCDSHVFPLYGAGRQNVYFGESNCGIKVKMKSDSLSWNEYYTGIIYPNPSDGRFNVLINNGILDNDTDAKWVLSNMYGKKLIEGNFNNYSNLIIESQKKSYTFELSAEGITNGFYYLCIITDTVTICTPVMIIR